MGTPNDNGGTPFNEHLFEQSYGDAATPKAKQPEQEPPAEEPEPVAKKSAAKR